jgi:hypothetical protein
MRKVRIPLLVSALTLAIALAIVFASTFTAPSSHALVRESCSCTAPDGSCSVSIQCPGGCTHFCGNDDNCYASCSGHAGGLGVELPLESQSVSSSKVVAESSRVSGRYITFSAKRPDKVVKVSLKKATVWEALELLSKHGTVLVDGQNFEKLKSLRKILLYDQKISYCVKDLRVGTMVNELSTLTGLPLRITEGDPTATVNICLQEVTLWDIISDASAQSGVKIVEVGAGVGGR